MSRTVFQNEAYRFLTNYKHNAFPNTKDGTWRSYSYGHIFTKEDAPKNFLITDLSRYSIVPNNDSYKIEISGHRPFSLHTDWAHLNSSQVLCINYFFDFLSDTTKLTSFVRFLGIDMKPSHGEFEVDPGDGSSIDFVVHFENGNKLFCEIKYSESNFGSADIKKYGNDFYLARKQKYYRPVQIGDDNYFKHYQIVRNICLATSGNHTLFLYPSHNKSVSTDLSIGLKTISNTENFAFHSLTWEELLKAIPNHKVQEKYFPYM